MKKIFSFLITLLGVVVVMFVLSFLYVKGYFDGLINTLTGTSTTQVINSPNPNGMKYISERSFSMRFKSKTEYGFGTGWLFAKDESAGNNDLTYYVATNLHVASFIKNSGKSYYAFDQQTNNYKLKTDPKFDWLEIGQIGTWNGDTFIPGTDKAQLGLEATKYYEYFSLSDVTNPPVSIAYETFDMFKNSNISSQYNIYDEEKVSNGTLDLAILKMDFSRIKQSTLLSNSVLKKTSPVKDMLKLFDSNPTKFVTKGFDAKNDIVTVGGFPASQAVLTGPSSNWNSASNTLLFKEQDGSRAISNLNWKDGIVETNNDTIKKKYALKNHIAYVTDSYASYLNVAKQNLFYNMDLSGGSSGSMAVNQNNEVIGIYWGTYSFSNGMSYGVTDSFVNDKTSNYLSSYNLYNDFNSKVPNSSLSKQMI